MVPDNKKYILYLDDTGSRSLHKEPSEARQDNMNCFGLGGILVKGEDDEAIYQAHTSFCQEWKIDYPLHSTKIRGRRGNFGWLSQPEEAGYFMPALREFLLAQPFLATAVIIDRQGYFQRYRDQYAEELWQMDKTVFSILIERVAKFAEIQDRRLEIVFEASGKAEDRALIDYMKALKKDGSPFNTGNATKYSPLSAEEYSQIVLGDPRRKNKELPQLQLADLVLFPLAKGQYDSKYRPYQDLKLANKLIDDHLPDERREELGIKYSCFQTAERPKAQGKP